MYEFLIGTAGSILAALIGYFFRIWREKRQLHKNTNQFVFRLGAELFHQGITKFHFSRDDYGRTLRSFVETAKNSITLVSVSLKITHEEGQLTDLFRTKIVSNPDFEIKISLINPNNDCLLHVVSDTLHVSKAKLKEEIVGMLVDLLKCRNELKQEEKVRLKIMVHDCFPMGSAILLDASNNEGMVQIETKLYKAPRTESFGFQITKKSAFYKNNFTAWQKVVSDSKEITLEDLNS